MGVMQSAKMELQTAAAAATLTAVASKEAEVCPGCKGTCQDCGVSAINETEEEEVLAGEPEAEGGGLVTLSEAADTAAGKLTIWMNVQQK